VDQRFQTLPPALTPQRKIIRTLPSTRRCPQASRRVLQKSLHMMKMLVDQKYAILLSVLRQAWKRTRRSPPTQTPGSPTLDAAIPCGENLAVPGRSQRSTSFGGETLVPDGEDVANDGGGEHVGSATKLDDYAPAFRLQLRKTTVSWPFNLLKVSLLITFGLYRTTHTLLVRIPSLATSWKLSTIQRWRKIPSTCGQSNDSETRNSTTSKLTTVSSFVANNTQENSIYASEKTVETIIESYGLQTRHQRLSGSPQMGTFQLFEPLGDGDFSECPQA
jgi:hypothetical protein